MNTERKIKLINYLYPTNEVANFMYSDLYVELIQILPRKVCFSSDNYKKANRDNNFKYAYNVISQFIEINTVYKNRLIQLYPNKSYNNLICDIIVGYTFYLTPHINKNTGADVFLDKRSVCYSSASVLDLR